MHHPSSSADFSYEDSGHREPPSAPPQPPAPPPPTPILPHSLGVHGYDNTKFSQDIDQNLVSNVVSNKNNPPHFPIRRYLTSHPRPVAWSSGLFDCFDDVHSCCLTCCCPCVTFGRIAEIVDKGTTSCGISAALYAMIMCITGCSCMYSCFYRSKLRGQYFLEESPCADCCVHCFCEGCALCQEYRELKNQDFDMSIGWHGKMEKQKQSFVEPPSTQYGMKR